MARKNYTMSGFGILNTQVSMTRIAKEIELSFKERHSVCGYRLGRKTWCNHCNVEVLPEEKEKGWVFNDKEEIPQPWTKAEIDSLRPSFIPQATIEILNVIDSLDYRWFKGGHYVMKPDKKNPQYVLNFNLILSGLESSGKVALIRWYDSRTVYHAILNSHGIVSTIWFGDEVDTESDNVIGEVDAGLLNLVTTLMNKTAKPFNPKTDVVNTFREECNKLALEKQTKGTFTLPEQKAEPKVNATADLMALLQSAIQSVDTQATGTDGK